MSRDDPATEVIEWMALLQRIAEALELSNALHFLMATEAEREQAVSFLSQYQDMQEAARNVLRTSK